MLHSKTAGVTEDHLISILGLRGVTRVEARQLASDILQDREEPESSQYSGIFSQVKVFTGLLGVKNILG